MWGFLERIIKGGAVGAAAGALAVLAICAVNWLLAHLMPEGGSNGNLVEVVFRFVQDGAPPDMLPWLGIGAAAGSLLGVLNAVLPPPEIETDSITCSVFAPRIAAPGDEILIQAFVHLPRQKDRVAALAVRFDPIAEGGGGKPLNKGVARGETLAFHLRMTGVVIDDPSQELIWRGEPDAAQFGVLIPEDSRPRSAIGTIIVSKDGAPIGHIKFTLQVVTRDERQRVTAAALTHMLGTLSPYRSAFISYAREDRPRAVQGAQVLAAAKIKYFQDVLTLDPGDRWEKELYRHIDNADVFFLYWSKSAKDSEWVRKEAVYAHDRQGGKDDAPPEIIPIIIEGPPPVEPPQELAFLHFNDKFTYLNAGVEVEAERLRKQSLKP